MFISNINPMKIHMHPSMVGIAIVKMDKEQLVVACILPSDPYDF